jgi:glutathione S-transferase
MIELIQFPWSPFCIVQRRILEFSGVPFKIINIPNADRTLVWKLAKQRYYGVPIIRDGKTVVFELNDDSQVIAKYLNEELELNLFPAKWGGVQSILWRYIENEVEGAVFRLNDIYWKEFVPKAEQVAFLRHKERKFGHGCIDQWRKGQKLWLKQLEEKLIPFEQMLLHTPFLLDDQPHFVDFDLFGMLENFLFSGHYKLPKPHWQIRQWHRRMAQLKRDEIKGTPPSSECLLRKQQFLLFLLRAQNGVLRGFGDAEFHDAFGCDLDGFAGLWVAAHTGGPVAEHELADAGQREGILRVLVGKRGEVIKNFRRLLLGECSFLSNCGDELGFRECFCHNCRCPSVVCGFLFLVKKSYDLLRIKSLRPNRASKKL